MNSKTLIETGFSEWFPLKTLTHSNLPADKGSVIIIVNKELSGKPETDILYIGRTKKPVKKILGGYLAGYGGKNSKKINQMLFDEGYIEKAAVGWILTEKPRIMQEELLAKFKADHGELPIWNAKKKLDVKPKEVPAFKTKKAPALKTKAATPKAMASSSNKAQSKAKNRSNKETSSKNGNISQNGTAKQRGTLQQKRQKRQKLQTAK